MASPNLVNESTKLLEQVSGWNKGVESTAEALNQLRPINTGDTTVLPYWQSVSFASSVPGKVTARSNEAKALKARIESHPWFVALSDLAVLTQRLQWAWQHQLADSALPELGETLKRHRLITQDGLIGALFRALHRDGSDGEDQSKRLASHLAERYHVALIDESQDTDPRQFAIFARIFLKADQPRHLILVGDPKQAIYSFRGADLSTYLGARAEADTGYTLTRTYRAPSGLVETINHLFQRERSFHHPDMMFRPAVSALAFDRQLLRDGMPCSRFEAWIVPDTDARTYSTQRRRIPAISARVASTIVDLLHQGRPQHPTRAGVGGAGGATS